MYVNIFIFREIKYIKTMGNCNGVDKCCGRAGTHEEMKNFYDKPMPYTPIKGRSLRMPSTSMSEEDTPPFGEKQV